MDFYIKENFGHTRNFLWNGDKINQQTKNYTFDFPKIKWKKRELSVKLATLAFIC